MRRQEKRPVGRSSLTVGDYAESALTRGENGPEDEIA